MPQKTITSTQLTNLSPAHRGKDCSCASKSAKRVM